MTVQPQMLLEIGVVHDPKNVGYWSGLAESAYAISQLLTGAECFAIVTTGLTPQIVFPATWVANTYGRKPVIIWSAVIVAISMVSFGVSTDYSQMILSRILGGVEGGSSTCLRVMASEISSKETKSHVFSLLGVAYRTGQILGQPVGGVLVHPERRFPALFDAPFWRTYPYALPCFVGGAYALLCAILGQIILRETLTSKRGAKKASPSIPGTDSDEAAPLLYNGSSGSSTPAQEQPPNPTVFSLLTWPLASLLLSTVAMVLMTEMFFAVYPLFAFTPIELGGLGLSEAQIGFHMSLRSVLSLLAILAFSRLSNRFGKLNIYRFSIFAWLPTILLFPLLNRIARAGGEDSILWFVVLFLSWTAWSATGWGWGELFIFVLPLHLQSIDAFQWPSL